MCSHLRHPYHHLPVSVSQKYCSQQSLLQHRRLTTPLLSRPVFIGQVRSGSLLSLFGRPPRRHLGHTPGILEYATFHLSCGPSGYRNQL
jgi:hypothetical protein